MMLKKKLFAFIWLAALFVSSAAVSVRANDKEYEAVVRHLKSKYHAKKVSIPFMWLARAAVKVARPAGVKSFNLTVFENLNFSRATLDQEMRSALRESFSAEWTPIFRVHSKTGEQAYMYMREAGADIRLVIVTIDNENATVIRARFSPDKLASFIDNPKIFGISLDDGDDKKAKNDSTEKSISPETAKSVSE